MNRKLVYTPVARSKLISTARYIAVHFGAASAYRYAKELEDFCNSLALFPHKGVAHDDIRSGLRIAAYKRKSMIGFLVEEDRIVILQIWNRGEHQKL